MTEERIAPDNKRCTFITKSGSRCKKERMEGEEACYFHLQIAERKKLENMRIEVGEMVEMSARTLARLQAFVDNPNLQLENIDMAIAWLIRWGGNANTQIRWIDEATQRKWR